MSSRLKIVAGLAAVAVLALGWSAFAADDRNRGEGGGQQQGERWEIPVPPPPGGEGDRTFRFQGPAPGEEGERGAIPLPPPGGPLGGPLGPDGGELTNGELNVQRDGEAVTLRVDHGEIAAADSDSITVSENDGNDVEIPVDEETEVMAGPFAEGTEVSDLEEGDVVHVVREDGQAAERICVLPDGPPPELDLAPRPAPGQSG